MLNERSLSPHLSTKPEKSPATTVHDDSDSPHPTRRRAVSGSSADIARIIIQRGETLRKMRPPRNSSKFHFIPMRALGPSSASTNLFMLSCAASTACDDE